MIAAPRVSVVIATYNRAPLVVEAIHSVLRQSFRDLEILVADDGSTDDTAVRVAAIEGPIHYLRLPHTGHPSRVRNAALRHARGELVAFLDDDDGWEPDKLARQVALLDAEPAVGLVYTGFSVVDDDGRHTPELAPWETARGPLLDRLLRGCFIPLSTVVMPRALLERVGGFDESRPVAEDYDLWLRLAPLTGGACIAEPLTRIRRGGTNLTVSARPLVYEVAISILKDRLSVGTFELPQRLRCRTAISNLHARASGVAWEAGNRRRARRHALAAVRSNPLQRCAWSALRDCLRRGTRP